MPLFPTSPEGAGLGSRENMVMIWVPTAATEEEAAPGPGSRVEGLRVLGFRV